MRNLAGSSEFCKAEDVSTHIGAFLVFNIKWIWTVSCSLFSLSSLSAVTGEEDWWDGNCRGELTAAVKNDWWWSIQFELQSVVVYHSWPPDVLISS